MNTSSVHTQDGVFKRVLLLYGLFMLLSNAAFLVGYYLLPQVSCSKPNAGRCLRSCRHHNVLVAGRVYFPV